MPETGSAEAKAPKPGEPFPRQTGDMSPFSGTKGDEQSLVNQRGASDLAERLKFTHGRFKVGQTREPYQGKESDSPSLTETTDNEFAEFVNDPEVQKLMQEMNQVGEDVASQSGALDIIKGFAKWAGTTGDRRIVQVLTGNVADIVRRFTKDPNKALEIVEAWTEEESQTLRKDLEDKGIISKTPSTEKAADAIREELKSTPPTAESPTTTAK